MVRSLNLLHDPIGSHPSKSELSWHAPHPCLENQNRFFDPELFLVTFSMSVDKRLPPIVVTKTMFILGWTLAANTRYPFPDYIPNGVVIEMDYLLHTYPVRFRNTYNMSSNRLHA